MELVLKAQKRDLSEKNRRLRKAGYLPGIVYGHKFKNIPIKINYHDFVKIFKEAGETTLIKLEIEGTKNPLQVFIYDIQQDPVSDKYLHVDFYRARMDEKMQTEVPLEFIGEAPAVKDLDGILVTNIRAVEVEALPKDMPHTIKVDLSKLTDFESQIKIKDLSVSPGVKILQSPDEVIALVEEPRSKEELEALEEEAKEEVTKVEGVVKPEEEIPVSEEEQKEAEEKPISGDNE